jgi:hypothetical protein
VREFLAEKFHASGFDKSIKGDKEKEARFIREAFEMFGLVIDTLKMLPNPGKRSLMKLMLNNLWGRFSLRNVGLWQTLLTTDMAVVGEYLDMHDVDVMALDLVDEDENGDGDVVMISYTTTKEYVEEHDCSNVGKKKSDQFKFKFLV